VTAYGEDCVCQASGGMCMCDPQITDAEVKHLLHVSHMELASVHWDSYPDVGSPSSAEGYIGDRGGASDGSSVWSD
jgi:hypothetical protein